MEIKIVVDEELKQLIRDLTAAIKELVAKPIPAPWVYCPSAWTTTPQQPQPHDYGWETTAVASK